jgi:protein CpxP
LRITICDFEIHESFPRTVQVSSQAVVPGSNHSRLLAPWQEGTGATFASPERFYFAEDDARRGLHRRRGPVKEAGEQMNKSLITALLGAAMMATWIPVLAQAATDSQAGSNSATQNAPAQGRRGFHHGDGFKHIAQKLNLTQQQQDQLKPIFEKQHQQVRAIRQDTSLSQDQKKQKIDALHQDMQTQMNAVLTPAQQQQWAQMKAQGKQKMGARMAKKLNLSAQQQEQLKPIFQKRHEQAKAIWQDNALTKDQKKEKMQALRQQTKTQMDAVLTPEQQQQLQQMRQNRRGHRHGGGAPATETQPAPQGA